MSAGTVCYINMVPQSCTLALCHAMPAVLSTPPESDRNNFAGFLTCLPWASMSCAWYRARCPTTHSVLVTKWSKQLGISTFQHAAAERASWLHRLFHSQPPSMAGSLSFRSVWRRELRSRSARELTPRMPTSLPRSTPSSHLWWTSLTSSQLVNPQEARLIAACCPPDELMVATRPAGTSGCINGLRCMSL